MIKNIVRRIILDDRNEQYFMTIRLHWTQRTSLLFFLARINYTNLIDSNKFNRNSLSSINIRSYSEFQIDIFEKYITFVFMRIIIDIK